MNGWRHICCFPGNQTTMTPNTHQPLKKMACYQWYISQHSPLSPRWNVIKGQILRLGLTNRQSKFPMLPHLFLWRHQFPPETLHFSPHAQFCGCANITLHLVHSPQSTSWRNGGKSKEGMVDVNLGQLSVQFLPLRELFVSAAESFIIMGCWCAKGKARLSSDLSCEYKEMEMRKIKRKALSCCLFDFSSFFF